MSNQSYNRHRARGEDTPAASADADQPRRLVLVAPVSEPKAPDPPANTQEAFCARLKAARERRGLTLKAIAESTKISPSLLAALERNNLSRWPAGIYRRAFFTSYVQALGLPLEPTLAEFLRLFPDGEVVPAPAPRVDAGGEDAEPARIMLAGRRRPGAGQVRNALIEAAAVLFAALAAALLFDWGPWAAVIVVLARYGRPAATLLVHRARRVRRRV